MRIRVIFLCFALTMSGPLLAQQKIDSVMQVQQGNVSSVDSLKSVYADSLKNAVSSISNLQKRLSEARDSAQRVRIQNRLDSVVQKKDSVIHSLQEKLRTLKRQELQDLGIKGDKLDQAVAAFDKELPASLGNINLPSEVPSIDISGLSIPSVPKLDSASIQQYKKQLSEEQLTKRVEGLDELKKQEEMANQYKARIDSLKSINVQEQAQQFVQQYPINYFEGKEQQIQGAMEQISRYKEKYPYATSLAPNMKRPPNPMKGKPLKERLIPGVGFQIFGFPALLDINPYVGYRMNYRLTLGLGWNQRVRISDKKIADVPSHAYGPRGFAFFNTWRGYELLGEIEYLNTYTRQGNITQEYRTQRWVFETKLGARKAFPIYKRLRGVVLLQYNLIDQKGRAPYGDRFGSRFGVELSGF